MSKKLILNGCEDCRCIHKGYNWECENKKIWLVVTWTCSKKPRKIRDRRIPADNVIKADFDKKEFEEDFMPFIHYIPEWCPLEEDG